jgi:protein LSM14
VEINSENATVALENVMSYGTEDRRTGEEAYGPSTSLYDYILFRGSDVKDLRIEEAPKETSPAPPPQMPNDPAILGVSPSPSCKTNVMKYTGCKIINHRKRKTLWISPLPSF